METIVMPASHPQALSEAVRLLQRGQLVAFPTDTVYGLGAQLHNIYGIEQLYIVKGREAAKAIPVLIGDPEDLKGIARNMTDQASRLAQVFWPGPLTIVVSRRPELPSNLGPEPTIGVRMPGHPVALALLRAAGAMAVTSANLSGGANTCTAGEVIAQLNGRIALILDGGRTPGIAPSTVVDCTGSAPVMLRSGPVTFDAILAALA